MKRHWTEKLVALDACSEAVVWARGYRSLTAAWNACERGDWMIWLLTRDLSDDPTTPERRKLAGLCAKFSRRALKHAGEYRAQIEPTIKLVERWARNDPRVTLEMLNTAREAAWEAAWEAAREAARAAAWEAAWAAASAAARAANEATRAATSEASAAELRAQTGIIRKLYPRVRMPKRLAPKL